MDLRVGERGYLPGILSLGIVQTVIGGLILALGILETPSLKIDHPLKGEWTVYLLDVGGYVRILVGLILITMGIGLLLFQKWGQVGEGIFGAIGFFFSGVRAGLVYSDDLPVEFVAVLLQLLITVLVIAYLLLPHVQDEFNSREIDRLQHKIQQIDDKLALDQELRRQGAITKNEFVYLSKRNKKKVREVQSGIRRHQKIRTARQKRRKEKVAARAEKERRRKETKQEKAERKKASSKDSQEEMEDV